MDWTVCMWNQVLVFHECENGWIRSDRINLTLCSYRIKGIQCTCTLSGEDWQLWKVASRIPDHVICFPKFPSSGSFRLCHEPRANWPEHGSTRSMPGGLFAAIWTSFPLFFILSANVEPWSRTFPDSHHRVVKISYEQDRRSWLFHSQNEILSSPFGLQSAFQCKPEDCPNSARCIRKPISLSFIIIENV